MRSIQINGLIIVKASGGDLVFLLLRFEELVALGFLFFISSSNFDIIYLRESISLVEHGLSDVARFELGRALSVSKVFFGSAGHTCKYFPLCRGACSSRLCNSGVRLI